MAVPVVYSDRYHIDLGPHVFPTEKYRLVQAAVLAAGLVQTSDVCEPDLAGWDQLRLVHTSEYLTTLHAGGLSAEESAELQLPWSREMVEAFRLMVGGTITAARLACDTGSTPAGLSPVAVHLGGGLHHAFPNHGEGFCPFNDIAVAVRVLQRSGFERVAVVDLDVHHGNGTAFVFESDPRVFTFSMHQQHNYPMWKPRGSLDIGLADGTTDATYLRELERALPKVMAHKPDCVFYLAGADPYADDQLGGLSLTREGLCQRDRAVVECVRASGTPLVITLAGGYARVLMDTISIHVATVAEAVRSYGP